jgi:hypothetical protein
VKSQTRQQIFRQSDIHADLDPHNIKFRESVDSDKNPNATPIILAVDETGSMGMLAEEIIKRGLGVIMQEIYDRQPVTDPHIMCMGIGDAFSDSAPLQVTQFEADVAAITTQIQNIYLEGNGGGNGGESYGLAWYFAAYKTICDSQRKRHKKGYIFTIGDENIHKVLTKEQIKAYIGDDIEADINVADLYNILKTDWEILHLIVKPAYPQAVTGWKDILGERAIEVSDHNKLAEVIVSTIQVIEGHDADAVVNSWSGDTSLVVKDAIHSLAKRDEAESVQRL